MLGDAYNDYENALDILGLESLEERRNKLCSKFALKSAKHTKHKNWFKPNLKTINTRGKKPKYCPVYSNHTRFNKSPLSFLTYLLNLNSDIKQ